MSLSFTISRADPTKTIIRVFHYEAADDPPAYKTTLEVAAGRTYEEAWGDIRTHVAGLERTPIADPFV